MRACSNESGVGGRDSSHGFAETGHHFAETGHHFAETGHHFAETGHHFAEASHDFAGADELISDLAALLDTGLVVVHEPVLGPPRYGIARHPAIVGGAVVG
jgi:hypothetical protein